MYHIHSTKITTDAILDNGDTELAKKLKTMLSWGLRIQKINASDGDNTSVSLCWLTNHAQT